MSELEEYRIRMLEKLEEAARAFRTECLAAADPYAPSKQGWSVHQIAVHTRDVDQLIYGLRARRTAMEDHPKFESFDGDAYMAKNYDASESLEDLLTGFVENVDALVELLRDLPPEGWSRPSSHATLGQGLTLQSWVEKDLAHIEEHLKDVIEKNKK
jgi:DinB family protein